MSDNTIFSSPLEKQEQTLHQNVSPQQSDAGQFSSVPPYTPPPHIGGTLRQKILYGSIGLFVIILFGFLITYVVLPFFEEKEPEKVTLVYWGLWEDKGVMQEILDDFHRKNPHITVKYSKENIKQYKNRLQTRILESGKDAPDIFRFHNTWVPSLQSILLPLPSDVMTNVEFLKIYYPVAKKDIIRNGAIYGMPLHIDTLGLYINMDILNKAGEKPPITWEEYIETARRLTVKENRKIKTSGGALGTYSNITHASDIIALLFAQNGADSANLLATKKNATEVFDFYTLFAKTTEAGENIWDDTLDPSILAFAKEQLVMYIGYSWDIIQIRAKMRETPNGSFNLQTFPVPYPSTGKPITIASYWVEGVSAKTKHPKEAFIFMKYLSQKDVQQKLFTKEAKIDPTLRPYGELYSHVDLAQTLKNNTLAYPFIERAPDAVSSFFASDTGDEGYNGRFNQYLANAVNSVLDNTSSESAIETLAKGIAQILEEISKNEQP